MKKFFTLIILAFCSAALWAASPASTAANPFHDDFACFSQELAGIEQLEMLVQERNVTYTDLAAENNALLQSVNSDNADLSNSLLAASSQMDSTLKIVLVVLIVLAVIACGCFLISAIASANSY